MNFEYEILKQLEPTLENTPQGGSPMTGYKPKDINPVQWARDYFDNIKKEKDESNALYRIV